MIAEVASNIPLVFSWWIPLILALTAAAIRTLIQGIKAEETVRARCHEDVVKIRDVLTTTDVWPALSRVAGALVVSLPRVNKWAGDSSVDPGLERELLRLLKVGYPQLEPSLTVLEEKTSPLVWATFLHDRLVAMVRAAGVLAGILVLPLGYFTVRLVTPSLIPGSLLTIPLDALAMLVLGAVLGPLAALWIAQVNLGQQLSHLVRALKPAPGGSTS